MSSFAKTHLRCMHAVRAALHVPLHDLLPAVPLSHYRRGRLACKSIRLSVMKRALCSQRLGRLQSTSTSSSGLYRVHIQAFSSKVSANVRTGDKRLVVAIGWLGSKQKHFDKLAASTSCLPAPATAIACSDISSVTCYAGTWNCGEVWGMQWWAPGPARSPSSCLP